MDATSWGFIGTLVGAIVGALASVLTTIITGWNTRKLQAHSDSLQRLERSREFQRTNLLALQEALALHGRIVARAHLEDLRFYRTNSGSAKRPLLSEDLNQEMLESNRRASLLTERVSNDHLRDQIKKMRRTMNEVLDARSVEESERALRFAMGPFEKTMEALGSVLRSYY